MHEVEPRVVQDRFTVFYRSAILGLSAIVLFVAGSAVARADECPVRVLSVSLEGKGTSDHLYRYRVVLEAESGTAPQEIDLRIQTSGGRVPISARAPHLQFYQDEDAYDDVVVFDRPSQDVSGIEVADNLSGDVTTPCTSPTARVGDPVVGLVGWDTPSVIATFNDAESISPDVSQIDLLPGRSKNANFKTKGTLFYPQIAQNKDESGEAVAIVRLGPLGQVETAGIGTSSGSQSLDAAALDAVGRSSFSPTTRDGIPIVSGYKIVYEFRLDGEPWVGPPEMADLFKTYCPAILGEIPLATGLNSGQAFWYELNLSTIQARPDSVKIDVYGASSQANELTWNLFLRDYRDTTAARDADLDYLSVTGALLWPGPALAWGTVQEVTQRATTSATCRPYPSKVKNELDSDSLVVFAKTDRPWLTAPAVEAVLPARFAMVSWPKYAPSSAAPQEATLISVEVHVSPAGEPLVGVVHGVSVAPGFAAAALNAAMTSRYVVPRASDGAPLTQTFDIEYLYVPTGVAAGKPLGPVSLDRSDGIRQRTPHD